MAGRRDKVDSHCVAPSASAASRCSRGTAISASRETEMMNGKVMIGENHSRRQIAHSEYCPLKSGRKPSTVL